MRRLQSQSLAWLACAGPDTRVRALACLRLVDPSPHCLLIQVHTDLKPENVLVTSLESKAVQGRPAYGPGSK